MQLTRQGLFDIRIIIYGELVQVIKHFNIIIKAIVALGPELEEHGQLFVSEFVVVGLLVRHEPRFKKKGTG